MALKVLTINNKKQFFYKSTSKIELPFRKKPYHHPSQKRSSIVIFYLASSFGSVLEQFGWPSKEISKYKEN